MPRILKKNWLDSYLEFVDGTENPRNYNTWAGISILASTLKRKTCIYFHGTEYYPNQYIVLIGPPGIGKGRAMKPALTIAKDADTVNFIEDRITPEKLIARLEEGKPTIVPMAVAAGQSIVGKDCSGCAVATELAAFLSGSEWMHTLLCDLWDRKDYNYDTKNKGSFKIDNLCFSLLAGCTPDYIRSLIREKISHITGGFTARTIFVYASQKNSLISDAFGRPNGNKLQLEQDLVNDLKEISLLSGDMELTDDAKIYWRSIYDRHNTGGAFDSDAYANFKSRTSSHILKTSIAISASRGADLKITETDLRRATKLVEEVGEAVDIVFKYVGESPIGQLQERIKAFIQARGLCTRPEILRYNHRYLSDEQLTIVLRSLEIAGFIVEKMGSNGKIQFEWVG